MKVVIVHDFLTQWGGAENVVNTLSEMFPDAPIVTSIVNRDILKYNLKNRKIITSFLQYIPFKYKLYKYLFLLYPIAFFMINLKRFDIIISSSAYFCKAVRKRKDAYHINYCHTPMRAAWLIDEYLENEKMPLIVKFFIKMFAAPLKKIDLFTNKSVTLFVANSQNVQKRIKKYYQKESIVIHPPVSLPIDSSVSQGIYYIVISRLKAYKKIDIAVSACTSLGRDLEVIGTGETLNTLKIIAGPNIKFHGYLDDENMCKLLQGCKALIFPGEEDFGIVPVEAQLCGKPVIAYKKGGALETIIDGVTGVFFNEQTVESLIDAILRFEKINIESNKCVQNATLFSKEIFVKKMQNAINEHIHN